MTAIDTVAREAPSEEDVVRANVYSLLATLLSAPPTSELLGRLSKLDEIPDSDNDMARAWSVLGLAARQADIVAVRNEHHDLFIGLGRGELIPHGSWYLSGFLHEQPLARLRDDLARLGFERRDDVHEPEDHAAALCETLAMMVISPGKFGFNAEREFFKDHIEPWMERFFGDLLNAKKADFYQSVGQLGGCFLAIESAYFSMLV
jgi:TorA maturation chaperone TorD